MGGLLTHVSIALIGGLAFGFAFKNWKYGAAFAFGQFIPDMIDFGILGVIMGSLNPAEIMTHPWFQPLAQLGHTFVNWIIFGLIVFVIIIGLYHYDKIKYKTYKSSFIALITFLTGVAVHLIIDKLIIEKSPWI